jgi:hypothetical protein
MKCTFAWSARAENYGQVGREERGGVLTMDNIRMRRIVCHWL